MVIHERLFPRLEQSGYRVTSLPSEEYNCLAWAAGRVDEWWDPSEGGVWPDDIPRFASLDNLVIRLSRLGFETASDAALEPGYEKIAIYGSEQEFEHAARQLPTGNWTSKLGPDEDIEHVSVEALVGGHYGDVVRFLKRRLSSPGS